jgi:hypothetical protein
MVEDIRMFGAESDSPEFDSLCKLYQLSITIISVDAHKIREITYH